MDYHRPANDMMCVYRVILIKKQNNQSFYEYESPLSMLIAICDNLVLIQLLHMTLECQIKMQCSNNDLIAVNNSFSENSNELLPQGVT